MPQPNSQPPWTAILCIIVSFAVTLQIPELAATLFKGTLVFFFTFLLSMVMAGWALQATWSDAEATAAPTPLRPRTPLPRKTP